MSEPPVEKKPRKWKKLKIALLVVVVLAVLVGVRWQVGLWMARGAWEDALEKLREHGHPASFAELEALREDVWAEENAARVVEDLLVELDSLGYGKHVMFFNSEIRRDPRSYFFSGIGPDVLAESKAFYEQHKEIADGLSRLAGKPTGRSRFNYDLSLDDVSSQMFLPLASYRVANKFLCLQIALQLEEGQRQEAVESCVLLFNLIGGLDNDMTVPSYCVQEACQIMCLQSVEDVLRTGELTSDQIDLLEKALENRLEHFDPTRGFYCETLTALAGCEWNIREGLSFIDFSLLKQNDFDAFFNKAAEWQPEETLRRSQVVIVDWMLPLLDAASRKDWKAFREAAHAFDTADERERPVFDFNGITVKQPETEFRPFDRYWMPNRMLIAKEKSFTFFLQNRGEMLCAMTALEVEQFRMAHGRFPETLDELVPEYLDAVPVDPMDDQPLRYLHTDYGVVIYCVGKNGIDDGGAVESSLDEKGNVQRSLDRGFRLLVPEKRGVVYDDGSCDEVSSNGG